MASGSERRIVNGWTRCSYCAASTMYMKMNDSTNVQRKSSSVRSSSRPPPRTAHLHLRGDPHLGGRALEGLDPTAERVPRRDVRADGDHALSIEAVDAGRGVPEPETDDVVDPREHRFGGGLAGGGRHAAPVNAGRGPHEELGDRLDVAPVDADQPQLHVIGIVDRLVPVARDPVVAADGHAERVGDLADIDPEDGRPLAVDVHEQLRLVEVARSS